MEVRLVTLDNGREETHPVAVTMRTPGNDFELAAGFLYTEGILRGRRDVKGIAYCTDAGMEQEFNVVSVYLRQGVPFDPTRFTRHFYATSSCGVCGKTSLEAVRVPGRPPVPSDGPKVGRNIVMALPERLREAQRLFAATGGLHAAGLFDPHGTLKSVREDVGRHNAVDKIVGEAVLADRTPLHDGILVVSGRAGFEIVQKAAVAGVPFVVAVGAPSNLAVDLAKEFGMTLVGFVRSDRFNVYAGGHRLLADGSQRQGRGGPP
jgi:FdhD protein